MFETDKWNNIPECLVMFCKSVNSKFFEFEAVQGLLRTKVDQSFVKLSNIHTLPFEWRRLQMADFPSLDALLEGCVRQSEELGQKIIECKSAQTAGMKETRNAIDK